MEVDPPAANPLAIPDYIVIVGYFVLMLGIGVFFYRYVRDIKGYFSGSNRIPWWLSGLSYYMSCFSAFAFIAYAAMAWDYGWLGITVFWVMAPAVLFGVVFFAKRWRRARIDSPVEYLELRYSPAVRQVFAWQNLPVRIVDDALKLVSIGIFVSKGLGLDMKTAMLSSGVIILAYTLLGGLWAVAVTDTVQFIILGAAVVIILPLAVDRAGGLTDVFENAPEGFFHLTQPEQGFGWVYIGTNVFLFCLAFSSINWSLIQRYYCVPREKDAIKVGGLVFALSIIGPPLILLPVIAARQFLTGVEKSEQVYPILCTHLLPVGILGLVVAAMFSATMSMVSSDYNVCAGVLTNDVYRRYVRPHASQKELVLVGRLMTLVMGVCAIGVAFLMLGSDGEDLFRNMVKLFSIATVPVAIPMIAGLLSRRATTRSIWSGFCAGLAAGVLVFLLCPDTFVLFDAIWKKENAIVWITTAVTTIAMVLTIWLHKPDTREQERVDRFLDRLEVPIGQHEGDDPVTSGRNGADATSYRVVGISVWVVAAIMLMISPWIGGGLALQLSLGLVGVLILAGGLLIRAGRSA